VKTMEALRVNQLDAVMLDGEVEMLLRMQYMKVFELFKMEKVEKWKAELEGLLRLMVFVSSIVMKSTTYGNQLQNLVFEGEGTKEMNGARAGKWVREATMSTRQKVGWGIGQVLIPYVWAKLERHALVNRWADEEGREWKRRVFEMMGWIEVGLKVVNWMNLVMFLWNGQYVSVIGRVLRIRQVYQFKTMNRQVSFEFMNRQLIWSSFSELIMFLMPLVNLEGVKRMMKRLMRGNRRVGDGGGEGEKKENECGVCSASPMNTAVVAEPCGHGYCYYCLKTSLMTEKGFCCLNCGQQLMSMKRMKAE